MPAAWPADDRRSSGVVPADAAIALSMYARPPCQAARRCRTARVGGRTTRDAVFPWRPQAVLPALGEGGLGARDLGGGGRRASLRDLRRPPPQGLSGYRRHVRRDGGGGERPSALTNRGLRAPL